MQERQEKCYYESYQVCSSKLSSFSGRACPGKEACGRYISEEAYFFGLMNGTVKEEKVTEDPAARQARIEKNLRLEKSKKQLKREEKLEQEKAGDGTGFRLGDDPAFQELFSKTLNNRKK